MGSKVKQYINPRYLNIFTLKRFGNSNFCGFRLLACSRLVALSSPWVSRQRHVTSAHSARFARWVAYWTFIDHFTASSHTAVFLWSSFRFRKPLSRGYVFVSTGCTGVLVFLNRVFILPTARFVWSLPRTRWRHTLARGTNTLTCRTDSNQLLDL